jgi:hypothetical protein
MGFFRFYFACLRKALNATWYLICLVSTLLTFVILFIVRFYAAVDSTALNTLIWALPFCLVSICLLVVPWIETFRLYQEKGREVSDLTARLSAEQKEAVRQLSALKAELDNIRTPKVEITDEADPGTWNHHFRITVQNTSGATVEECTASIIRTEPPMDYLPIQLHWMHETRPHSARVN